MGRLMLLDTATLYFRAFHGVPEVVRAPDGTPVNAVRGLLDMLARLVADHRPTRLVACWDDDWRPEFRVVALPSYKTHRLATDGTGVEDVPAALQAQLPVIVEVLAALGVARVGAKGFEADDVIATLATREAARGRSSPVDVVTGDRDLFQLVDDAAAVRVLSVARGLRNLEVVDDARLRERYGVMGSGYADLATLRGDPSDGLPGVPGIGDRTAAELLNRYGDLAGVLAAARAGDPGLTAARRRRLLDAADYLALAPGVVRVVRDAPVRDLDDTLPAAPADPDVLAALARRWGLTSSVRRVLAVLASRGD